MTFKFSLSKYGPELKKIKKWLVPFWERPLHPQFTIHGLKHSETIERRIQEWLSFGNVQLNPTESFILLGAVYLHDIGMQCENRIFLNCHAGVPYNSISAPLPPTELNKVRTYHHILSYAMIRDMCTQIEARTSPEISFDATSFFQEYNAIALLAKGHCGEIEPTITNECTLAGILVRLLLLQYLLRIGDALDADAQRIQMEYIRPHWNNLTIEDKFHMFKHQYVSSIDVIGAGVFKYKYSMPEKEKKYFDIVSACAERAIRDHLDQAGEMIRDFGIPFSDIRSSLVDENPTLPFELKQEVIDLFTQRAKQIDLVRGSKYLNRKESFYDLARPLRFVGESSKHLPQFTGREWVGAKLDEWIINKRDSMVFCLLGGPGIGKSAIACHWCHTRKDVIAVHHCVHGDQEKTDPKRIFLSLAAQMSVQLPEYERRLSLFNIDELKEAANADARAVFDNFLLRPLSSDMPAPENDLLVVIDGLDEASRDRRNELASFIGEVWSGLPQWLRLVVTTRPELHVSEYLEHLHPFTLDASRHENLQDIRIFINRQLGNMKIHNRKKVINKIVDKSEGLFLYAKVVLDEIREGRLSLDESTDFPEGLTGYYKRWFDRKFPDCKFYQSEFHKLVSTIIAQQAPLPLNNLCSTLGLSLHDLQQRLIILGVLFPLREDLQGNQKTTFVTLMHKSLHDWLTETNPKTLLPRAGSFAADIELGNRLLAKEGLKIYSAGELTNHPYFCRTILSHLSEAEQTEELISILLDPTLILELWYKEFRYEWQRSISNLCHILSLTDLVQKWLNLHCSDVTGKLHIAVAADKLSQLFKEIGAFDEAILLAEAALHIWQTNNISDSPDMVGSLLVLGGIQSTREEIDQATKSYEKALAIAHNAYKQDSRQMADVFYELCVFYTQGKRDYKKAWDCLEKCLSIHSNSKHPDFVSMANCINDKAVLLEAEGKPGDYIGIYKEALALFEIAQPNGHPEMVATLGNIGRELLKQDKEEEAFKVFCRAMKVADLILLPQHEYSRFVRIQLTSALIDRGKYDEALEIMRNFVQKMERFPGPDHDDTASARLNLCQTLLAAVNFSDTAKRDSYREELLSQCQRIHQAKPTTIIGLINLMENSRRLAELLICGCLLDTVQRSCRGNVDRQHSNPSDFVSEKLFAEVLEALMSSKSFSELLPHIRTLWEEAEPRLKHQADHLPKTRKVIIKLISWFGRMRLVRDNDVESIHKAFDLITQIGVEIPEILDHLAILTVSLYHQHHEEISESLSQRLLEKSERILGSEHVQTLTYLENLAYFKMHQDKLEEAEHLFRRAFQSRLNIGGCSQKKTLSTITSLFTCLLLQGSTKAARTLINEFVAKLPHSNAFTSAPKILAAQLSLMGMQLKNKFSAFDESRACYELALEIDADNANIHNNMALLLWVCLDDNKNAADHFEKSLALNPTDGNSHSNYAHFFAQTLEKPKKALVHFKRAMSFNPNDSSILANYAAMMLLQKNIEQAWNYSRKAMRLCLTQPDRFMVRPLLCAAAILLLGGHNACIPLGQMKMLFAQGIDHIPWIITALLKYLDHELPADSSQLIKIISDAISDKKQLGTLEAHPSWLSLKEVSFETPWPELF